MTVQAMLFLVKAKKAQIDSNSSVYIDDGHMRLITDGDANKRSSAVSTRETSERLRPMLEYLADEGLIEIEGPQYFRLTYKGFHYWQAIASSVLRFAAASIAVPIGVSAVTTLLTIWLSGLLNNPGTI